MASNLLSDTKIRKLTEAGRYSDGSGLYLIVDRHGKRWLYYFQWNQKRREMGLGAYPTVSLIMARERAAEARRKVADGIDPIMAKRMAPAAASAVPTFHAFAKDLIEDLAPGWTGAKTRASWERSLLKQTPTLGPKPLDTITTDEVLTDVKAIWTAKPESAQKLRGRIENALDAAKAKGHRSGENPARWKGHLSQLLSKPQKLTRGHHRAIHYNEAPAVMAELAKRQGMWARALEWTIYSAAREGMTLLAVWPEIGVDWNLPPERVKMRRPFTVPITVQMRAVLEACDRSTPYVFTNRKLDGPMSDAAMDKLLKDMGIDATPHGFRSTFRDWAGDMTEHARETVETALDHAVGDGTERAYRRLTALEKRRALMQDWADFLMPRQSKTPPA